MIIKLNVSIIATSSMTKKDWMTGESVFGELRGGHVFQVSIGYCKRLLDIENSILKALGRQVAFEIAIGVNGLIWIDASSVGELVVVYNAILNAEPMAEEEAEFMIRQMFKNQK